MPCIPRIQHAPELKTSQARVDKAQAAVGKHNTNRTRYERVQGGYDQITRHADGSETRTPADHKDPRVIVAATNDIKYREAIQAELAAAQEKHAPLAKKQQDLQAQQKALQEKEARARAAEKEQAERARAAAEQEARQKAEAEQHPPQSPAAPVAAAAPEGTAPHPHGDLPPDSNNPQPTPPEAIPAHEDSAPPPAAAAPPSQPPPKDPPTTAPGGSEEGSSDGPDNSSQNQPTPEGEKPGEPPPEGQAKRPLTPTEQAALDQAQAVLGHSGPNPPTNQPAGANTNGPGQPMSDSALRAKAEAERLAGDRTPIDAAAMPLPAEAPQRQITLQQEMAASDPQAAQEVQKLREQDTARATRQRMENTIYHTEKRIEGNNINETYKITGDDGSALFKPLDGQHEQKERAGIEPKTQGNREVSSSLIAEALGCPLVPATTMITKNGRRGSAQDFKEGMINGAEAYGLHNIRRDPNSLTPLDFAPGVDGAKILEDWQMMDDLLLHGDRIPRNYMVKLDKQNRVLEVALVDNGQSLTATTGVLTKRLPGPREGKEIGLMNRERLRQLVAQEDSLTKQLSTHLEPTAIAGLFARAKALLVRGTYGNFTLNETNAHLPKEMRANLEIEMSDKTN